MEVDESISQMIDLVLLHHGQELLMLGMGMVFQQVDTGATITVVTVLVCFIVCTHCV